jgi:hypothetical protein
VGRRGRVSARSASVVDDRKDQGICDGSHAEVEVEKSFNIQNRPGEEIHVVARPGSVVSLRQSGRDRIAWRRRFHAGRERGRRGRFGWQWGDRRKREYRFQRLNSPFVVGKALQLLIDRLPVRLLSAGAASHCKASQEQAKTTFAQPDSHSCFVATPPPFQSFENKSRIPSCAPKFRQNVKFLATPRTVDAERACVQAASPLPLPLTLCETISRTFPSTIPIPSPFAMMLSRCPTQPLPVSMNENPSVFRHRQILAGRCCRSRRLGQPISLSRGWRQAVREHSHRLQQ